MSVFKNKYYFIIENIRDIDLKNIKLINRYIIIYRNTNKIDDIDNLLKFRTS